MRLNMMTEAHTKVLALCTYNNTSVFH